MGADLVIRLVALVAVVGALGGGVAWLRHDAASARDAVWEKREAVALQKQHERVAAFELDLSDAVKEQQERSMYAREKIRVVIRTLVKEVPVYVSSSADARCVVPVGFVRLHDACYGDGVPDTSGAARGPLDADSGIHLSQVGAAVCHNAGAARELQLEVRSWREWYAINRAAFDAFAAKSRAKAPESAP